MRRSLDAYYTPSWQTHALLTHEPSINGTILEPCAGDGSIVRALREKLWGRQHRIITNDVDPLVRADYHFDASSPTLYRVTHDEVGPIDWVVTNPPYKMPLCRDIVAMAVEHARVGVAMLLRISFREPTTKVNPRGPWLAAHPIHKLITLPRHSYTGDGRSDSVTTEWCIWRNDRRDDEQRIISAPMEGLK